MTALLLAAALTAAAVPCQTVQPGPAWVCHDGGWLPPGHPAIPQPPAPEPPTTAPPPQGVLVLGFQLGHKYKRDASGVEIYVAALGSVHGGIAVYAFECLTVSPEDQCFFPGEGRYVLATASASGWTEQP